MSQKIALLICASPANREQPSVYIPAGKWAPDISEIVDSKFQIYVEEPIFTDNWKVYSLEDGHIMGPGNFRCDFVTKGTEKHITIMLTRVEE